MGIIGEILVVSLHPLLMGVLVNVLGGKMDKEYKENNNYNSVAPPGWLFGVMWPFLFTCIGFAWAFAGFGLLPNILYSLLDISLLLWPILFNRFTMPKYSMFSLHVSIMCSLLVYANGPKESSFFISPLIAWLLLASKLNYTIAINSNDLVIDVY